MLIPIRRNRSFSIPQDINSWHGLGVGPSTFFNSLSIFFPVGERFFIQSVRNYQKSIKDQDLLEAVKAFIGQEAFHGREHEKYNQALEQSGVPVQKIEAMVRNGLGFIQRVLPKSHQLAITISLEHLTAIMGEILLKHPEYLYQSEENMVELWKWHAMEEVEHKSVAFDVYQNTVKSDKLRYAYLIISTIVFFVAFFMTIAINMHKIQAKSTDVVDLYNFSFGYIGAIPKMVKPWKDWFRRDFHPQLN